MAGFLLASEIWEFRQAMDRFGIDKPDLRYDMELLGGNHRCEVVVVVVSPLILQKHRPL